VGTAVDNQTATAANSFTTIVVKRDRFLPLLDQVDVEDVKHLKERRIRRHVLDFIFNESAPVVPILLAPNLQFEIHYL
jgi:hypothetical protein